jgi:uncharacterized repeat protein (TIGR01451 family)
MNIRRAFVVAALLLFAAQAAYAVSPNIVISQVYGGAGCGTAGCSTYRNDYIELFNRSGSPVTLTNWSVQYAAQTGTSWQVTTINATIPAGAYHLVQQGGNTNGVNVNPTPDTTGGISMSATSAKVALVNTNTALTGQCGNGATLTLPASVVDFVGYGTGANCNDAGATTGGAGNAPAPSTTTADLRAAGGCTDTDNNASDFTAGTPTPRNSSTALNVCGGPALPNLTVTDVSQAETNAGTTTFTFQVNLSAPAGPGGVTFDIATADGTAQDDNPAAEDNDYVAQSLTGQTIPAGSSSYAFNVTVNGDVIPESNETFFVNVTNVTGATVTDGQGQGTIQNDDVACASLSINDVTQAESTGGPTTFAFTVSLSQAGCGTVTFDIATADGTATTADSDYVAQTLTGETITFPSTYTFNVTVNGDATQEPDQTFFVNITNVSPGNVQVSDGQGLGTIVNDDFALIHDVQGNGAASPIPGASVTLRGIVTLLKSNGFFLQEELADYDADPNTSEGIFVFTSTPPTVAVGDDATVTGTVVEFNGLTEISPASSVTINSTGNPLPTAVTLTATDLPATATPDQPQLEKYEGMRVSAASLTTVAPNDNFFDVDTVLTSVPRPLREPGIPVSDPIPPDPTSGLPDPNIPIWDENPERLSVDTNGRAGSTGDTLTSNVTLTGVTGPLDFSFSRYRLINEANLTRTANMSAVAIPVPAADEFTIAGYNIENFNNNATQRQKAALTIRDVLRLPDIIGTVEIFDLADLQALATEIQTIAGVTYSAHLIEQDGTSEDNDQDVGYLVKTSRVSVTSVTQERASETYINPNTGLPETLHDRPPLVLRATVDPSGPAPQPVIVVVNHLRSFIDIDLVAGEGVRVRAKRKAQAESLADLLNDLQTDNPGTPVISVGDYNAFQFNNGYDDPISVLLGAPTPDDQIVVDQSPDLVSPDFVNLLLNVPADQRYSFIFENTPQSLDHVLVNTVAQAINTNIAVARVNADFPSSPAAAFASDAGRPEANSDHDPVVSYFQLPATADVSVTKVDNVDPVNAGQNFFYTVTVNNAGPDAADNVSWSDPLPANTTFVSLSQPGGWTCTTPAVGANGTVSCSIASLGAGSAAFNVTVAVDPALASGTVLSNTATVTSATPDPNTGNESDTETTTVNTSADLLLSKTDTPDPVNAGSNLSYQITITNNGPSNAASASFTDTLPAGTTFVSLSTTGPWSCTTPAVGATGTVTCTNPSFLVTVDFFTLVVQVTQNVTAGTVLSNTAAISSATPDPNSGNNSDTATTTVSTASDMQITKVDTPDPVTAGSNITYTINVNNAGPSDASGVTFTDTIPANTTFVSLTSFADFSCTTPAVGGTGLITCTKPSTFLASSSGNFTLVVQVDAGAPSGTVITNTATIASTTTETNAANNSATATTTVGSGSADVFVTKTDSPDPVVAGTSLTYTITVTNAGPSAATTVALSDTLPTGTTFVSLTAPGGWTCSTPAAGGTGAINCSIASLSVTSAVFTLVVDVDPALATGTVLSNTSTVSTATTDPNGANNSDTEATTVTASADLQVTKTDTPDPVTAGTVIQYTITVTNAGPSAALNATFTDTLPAGTTFASFVPAAGWTCTVPPGIPPITSIACTNASLAPGATSIFSLGVTVDPAATDGTVLTNTATVGTTTTDPNPDNNTATAATTVGVGSADLGVTKTDTPDPVNAGSDITYTITVANAGPTNAASVSLSDTLPANTTFVSLTSPAGWSCISPAVGAAGTVTCTNASLAPGNAVFSLVVRVVAGTANGTVITNTATVSSTTADPATGNESASTTTTVVALPNVSGTKGVTGTFVPGGTVTYTVVLTNTGTGTQADNAGNEFVDVLPAQLILTTATATSGTAVATVGTNTVTWNGSIAAGASVTITINATIRSDTAPGTVVSNQGTINYDADGNGTNESTRQTDSASAPGGASDPTTFSVAALALEAIPTLDELALMALAALLAMVAALMLKK